MIRRDVILGTAIFVAGCARGRPDVSSKQSSYALARFAVEDLNSDLYRAYLHEADPGSPGAVLLKRVASSTVVTTSLRAQMVSWETGLAGRDQETLRKTVILHIQVLNLNGGGCPAVYVVSFESGKPVRRYLLAEGEALNAWKASWNWRPESIRG
jgi:hypothetical protein